ncbi:hypothetical protein HCN44_009729 [Aphidius gifuensis]|uniref:Uncharacterized protein n=1 Tax=Aphidius gifuensis TaxID=684658 RepID=A0A834Y584_APHGI|nr:hypothetical protein HCN44_009729 [Aphidius gifuensis]
MNAEENREKPAISDSSSTETDYNIDDLTLINNKNKQKKLPTKLKSYDKSSRCEKTTGVHGQSETLLASKNLNIDQSIDIKNIERITQRIDIYYFDHGNSAYYKTTDASPILTTEKYAEKIDQAATRFWAEIFGTIHIGITFITAFILQLLRFFLYSLVRPLTIGVIQMFSDYFIKPLLTIFFNGIIQPILIFFYNIATSFRDLCEPIAQTFGFFIHEIAIFFRAIRLVEINNYTNLPT